MRGAINTIRGWREICKKNTVIANEQRVYRHCANCKLEKLCKKAPGERTDEDILDLVRKIGDVK